MERAGSKAVQQQVRPGRSPPLVYAIYRIITKLNE
jgi:hypothetical protein